MRKLTIYRGDTLIQEVPLTGETIRLGRSKESDVVLEDPGKGVSRTHAELRPEGDGFRLVDLESQNGIWVSGERVPSVLLAPGVVAAMGPFRVAINAASPITHTFAPITPEMLSETGTEFSRPSPPPPPAGSEPAAVNGPGALFDDPSPGTKRPPQPRPAGGSTSKKAASVAPSTRPARPATGAKWIALAVAAVALIAASAFGAYKLLYKEPPRPVWDATVAMNLANSGRCQEALDQQINPALQQDPNNAEAQSLKQKCTAPPPTTSTIPPDTRAEDAAAQAKQKLDDAETALAAKECQPALDAANAVLTEYPEDARARDIVARATGCLTSAGRSGTPADPVVKIAPAEGGLEPLPGELGKAYKIRVGAMAKRYDDAVALLQSQRYLQALRELEAIANAVPQGYRELAQRRAEARNGMREDANRAYAAGQQAEQASQWNVAIERYQRAHDLDPARDVTAEIARINQQKLKLGQQSCDDARAAYVLGSNTEAAQKYTRVLDLLPSDHACYAEAKERLANIRR